MVEAMVSELLRLAEQGAAPGSLDTERSQWNWWVQYCASLEPPTSPWRTDVLANAGHNGSIREGIMQAGFLPWVSIRMLPKTLVKRQKGLPAKPDSWKGALLGIRRIHRRLGLRMAPLTLALEVTKGLTRAYRDDHGVSPLLKHRKEPLTNAIILDILTLLQTPGSAIGKRTVLPGTPFWVCLEAVVHVMAQAGFRKNKVAVKSHTKDAWGRHTPSRASLAAVAPQG